MLYYPFMSDTDMDFTQFLEYMTNGNSAAAEVIRMMIDFSGPRTVRALNTLDDLNIRGMLIWYCFDDICDRNIELLFSRIEGGVIAESLENVPYAKYRTPR